MSRRSLGIIILAASVLLAVPCLAEVQPIMPLHATPTVINGGLSCSVSGGWGVFPFSEYPSVRCVVDALAESGYRVDLYVDGVQVSAHRKIYVRQVGDPWNELDERVRGVRWRHVFGANTFSPGVHVFEAVYIIEALGYEVHVPHEVLITYPDS